MQAVGEEHKQRRKKGCAELAKKLKYSSMQTFITYIGKAFLTLYFKIVPKQSLQYLKQRWKELH